MKRLLAAIFLLTYIQAAHATKYIIKGHISSTECPPDSTCNQPLVGQSFSMVFNYDPSGASDPDDDGNLHNYLNAITDYDFNMGGQHIASATPLNQNILAYSTVSGNEFYFYDEIPKTYSSTGTNIFSGADLFNFSLFFSDGQLTENVLPKDLPYSAFTDGGTESLYLGSKFVGNEYGVEAYGKIDSFSVPAPPPLPLLISGLLFIAYRKANSKFAHTI